MSSRSLILGSSFPSTWGSTSWFSASPFYSIDSFGTTSPSAATFSSYPFFSFAYPGYLLFTPFFLLALLFFISSRSMKLAERTWLTIGSSSTTSSFWLISMFSMILSKSTSSSTIYLLSSMLEIPLPLSDLASSEYYGKGSNLIRPPQPLVKLFYVAFFRDFVLFDFSVLIKTCSVGGKGLYSSHSSSRCLLLRGFFTDFFFLAFLAKFKSVKSMTSV